MTLSVGKLRGLQATSNEERVFTILAADHGLSLAATIRPQSPESVEYSEMSAVKHDLIRHLSRFVSAVLIDPVYGLAPAVLGGALSGRAGLLLAVEDGDYASVEKEARLFDKWSVAQAKQAGANAIKCFFYYHPEDEETAAHQEKFVRQLVADCATHDIPLFAEPLSYGTTPATRPRVVIETARRISKLGVDILKTEFPVDVYAQPDEKSWAAACVELSAVCSTPWVLLSAGVDFEMFARQVKVACQAGATGYLAGRAIWKEGMRLAESARQTFWKETARPRLQALANIASEYGRPWTDFYPFAKELPEKDWHQSIGQG